MLLRMESLLIVRLWAAAAWSDGKMHPSEAAALRRLIDASDDLDSEQRREALGLIEVPPRTEVSEVGKLRRTSREGVYRAALGIVRLDREVTADEIEWLDKLRASLDLDPETIATIEGEVR